VYIVRININTDKRLYISVYRYTSIFATASASRRAELNSLRPKLRTFRNEIYVVYKVCINVNTDMRVYKYLCIS